MQPLDISTSRSSVRRQVAAALSDQSAVDVDLAHVVDDHRDAQALAIAEHMVEQGRLARPREIRTAR
jgi:hypothetical protein